MPTDRPDHPDHPDHPDRSGRPDRSGYPGRPGPSGRPGASEPLSQFADILGRASSGVRPTSLELAELLWLAGQMISAETDPLPADPASEATPGAAPPPDPGDRPEPERPRDRDRGRGRGREHPRHRQDQEPEPEPPHDRPVPGPPPSAGAPRTPLRLPSSDTPAPGASAAEPHSALLAPAPPMLRRTLALQRSLRPLKRRTEAPVGREVDESATADRIARLGGGPEWWLPVLRPVRERWLRLHLVHDAGPTMPVWQPLVRELHAVLAQSGVFRTVVLHRAEADGTVRGDGFEAPADGRTVTLLISDCMGPQWREGPAGTRWFATLHRWARRTPLAVLQPLPEQLWRDTALPPVPGRLSAPHRAAPSARLAFTPYDDTAPPAPPGAVPVPVLEPGPEWLANWASLVAGPGGTARPGAAAALHRPLPADADDRTDLARLSPEDLVLRFRASASREAFRLAGHLALGRPDLPVMRLVQAAVEPDPRPQHLAEVILSGLLTTVAGPPGSYAFRPGVRDLLLRGLPRTARNHTHDLLLRTGGLIDERAGRSPGEFRALIPSRDGTERAGGGETFAVISEESARQLAVPERPGLPSPFPPGLATRYRPVRRLTPTGRVWLAEHTESNRTVAVRLHDRLPGAAGAAARGAFLRDARRLTEFVHPNVVDVLDAGVEDGVPYVVMEHLDGIAVNVLARAGDRRLPAPLTVSVGAQLARALTALHRAGLTHGGLEPSRLVLLPDGTVRLSLLEPGRSPGRSGRSADLRALCAVLLELSAGTSHLTVPIDSHRLDRLPAPLRIHYAHAFDQLMSMAPAAQARGLDLLTDPGLRTAADEAYTPRRYRALGPLRVTLPDGSPALPPDVRALLAMLLLKHGRTVTHEELRWGLWDPGDEPRNPRAELTRLAALLADALGPGALATLAHGYALHTSADHVDLVRCDELVRRADAARLSGALTKARDLVAGALTLWHDPEPLTDVPGPAARTARARLLRLRLALHTKHAELDLSLGDYDRASTDLSGLLRAHPHREDFRRLYLIALRRQGRGAEALEVYEEYELSGGRSPALAALGRELREEHAEPVVDAPWSEYEDPPGRHPDPGTRQGTVSAPDELPEGPYPTEDDFWTPLLDEAEVPDEPATVMAAEMAAEEGVQEVEGVQGVEEVQEEPGAGPEEDRLEEGAAGGDVDTDYRNCARFSFADAPDGTGGHGDPGGPGGPGGGQDVRERAAALHVLVTHLLADSGLDGAAYELVADREGLLVLLAPRVGAVPLLRATVAGLPGQLAHLGGARLRAEFWQVEFRLDGTGEQSFRADAESVGTVLDASSAQAVVALSDSLYYDEVYEEVYEDAHEEQGGPAPAPGPALGPTPGLFRPLADDTGWYRLIDGVREPTAPPPSRRAPRTPADLVSGARCVLLGFDDVLARLYRPAAEREVLLDIVRLFADERDPEDALAGLPLPRAAADGYVGTLDFVRALAGHRLAPDVRLRLDRHEARAARTAQPVPLADRLVQALHTRGVPVAVVTDRAPAPVTSYLRRRGLLECLRGGVHGRDTDLTRLMPDPDVLRRALERLDADAGDCVLVGSSVAEQSAARAAGLPFVGRFGDVRARRRLSTADGDALLVPDLRPLLTAAETR
ncbi:SAV_2336 N-terminal domain-related protein [Streptomyces mayonensis]|uniref:SAV_2336 N-terminal domain-related protein n=1 Tax=Streptomyces mayonensis TaxID=2750816 RepID=UPI001C1DE00A|nr:SAV_2336 N-terminal domain-related protein [Streptomyces sp. A108]MBU6536200.1 HAD hydrolase-like protein [Streptomyces sp. A108]